METTKNEKNDSAKRCIIGEVIEIKDSPDYSCTEDVENVSKKSENVIQTTIIDESEFVFTKPEQEEPIDLTFSKSKENIEADWNSQSVSSQFVNQTNAQQPFGATSYISFTSTSNEKGRKRKLDFPSIPNGEIVVNDWSQAAAAHTGSTPNQSTMSYSYASHQNANLTARQQEILKMAKSVFSKRTRTLYHWMYPSASKHQIKQVVSSTWDSMSVQEKNIYITQVLGRFGYTNASLMVNPQLGQIKELPPLPGIQEFNSKATELQNAISSISNQSELEVVSNEQPRKRVKLPKKNNISDFVNADQEFDDDPELSQELAQFSIMFKNKI